MRMRVVSYCFISACLFACGQRRTTGNSDIFSPRKPLAQLTDRNLPEVSGLASSAANPGLLWAHNDSGNPAIVYLVDEHLKVRLSCQLKGAKNRDWEDIAVGPGPEEGKSYLYVADIGDNRGHHGLKYIYRFKEPVLSKQRQIAIARFDTIVFRLEDGKKDTEAIMVDPGTRDIYIVSKREAPVHMYRLAYPYSVTDTLIAKKVISLPFTQIVAAGISADGTQILMKNYDHVYYWKTRGKPIIEVLRQKPEVLAYTEEPQGEAIAFNREGTGFYTLSEKLMGEKIYLYFYEKR